jgi:hypothetical protein
MSDSGILPSRMPLLEGGLIVRNDVELRVVSRPDEVVIDSKASYLSREF